MGSDQGDMRRKIDELAGEDPVLFPGEKRDRTTKRKTLEERLNAPPDTPPGRPRKPSAPD